MDNLHEVFNFNHFSQTSSASFVLLYLVPPILFVLLK